MDAKKIKLLYKKAIADLEAEGTTQLTIKDYKDFLAAHVKVQVVPYSNELIVTLVKIAHEGLQFQNPFNKRLLFDSIRNLYKRKPTKLKTPSRVFDWAYFFLKWGFSNNLEPAMQCGSILLRDARLNNEQIAWMLKNAFSSPYILNRVLRYPFMNAEISQWVRNNFSNDQFCDRRAECVSWLLNQDKKYQVPASILKADFEFLLEQDKTEFRNYIQVNLNSSRFVRFGQTNENPWWLSSPEVQSLIDQFQLEAIPEQYEDEYEEFALIASNYRFSRKRNYQIYYKIGPDFNETREKFLCNIKYHQTKTMLWAIYYSNLTQREKQTNLKQMYSVEFAYTFIHICRKMKAIQLLEWGMSQKL